MSPSKTELLDALSKFHDALELKAGSSKRAADLPNLHRRYSEIAANLREHKEQRQQTLSKEDLESIMAYKLAVCEAPATLASF